MQKRHASPKVFSEGYSYGVKHFSPATDGPLVEITTSVLQKSTLEIEFLLQLGAIYVDEKRQTLNSVVFPQQKIRVHTLPRRYNCNYDWLERIVFETNDFVVLNKPCGIPSHPSVDNQIENSLTQLSLALAKKYQAPNFSLLITHRLDTLTEGLIVYGKNTEFVRFFNLQLQAHQIEKKYCALVETKQKLPFKVMHYMQPSPRAPKHVSLFQKEANWALCELQILEQKTQVEVDDVSWVKINLLTGRTHQIRAQLADLQAPILGDTLYGAKLPWQPQDPSSNSNLNPVAIALRACELQFNWQGQRLQFKLPEELKNNDIG